MFKLNFQRSKSVHQQVKEIQEKMKKEKQENVVKTELQKRTKMTGKNVSMFLKFKLSTPCQSCHR